MAQSGKPVRIGLNSRHSSDDIIDGADVSKAVGSEEQ
jgi:hypothetical protein